MTERISMREVAQPLMVSMLAMGKYLKTTGLDETEETDQIFGFSADGKIAQISNVLDPQKLKSLKAGARVNESGL